MSTPHQHRPGADYNAGEVAFLISMSVQQVTEYCETGVIPAVKNSDGGWSIPIPVFENWIAGLRHEATNEPLPIPARFDRA